LIRDLGSTNGTYLNGERLTPHKDYRLRASDEVTISNVAQLVFDDPATTNQLDPSKLSPVGLRLDEASAQVYVLDRLLDPPLSPSQFVLMTLLVQHEDVVVTREQIRDFVWGPHEEVNDQTIDALVSRLRKRLEEADPEHEYILTRRGFGLMFRNRRGVAANR
jgi:DNA-binding response OmpR family regulator